MPENSRTKNAIKNSTVTLACQVLNILITFACRTIFAKLLGAEYLGIKGLFSNVLTMLSFAELGIGTALVYRLYGPFAENDKEKIKGYLHLYKRIYIVIILVIMAVGLAIMPLIPYMVTAPDVRESLKLLYLLFLGDTLVSYVYVYKRTLLIADQKNYIVEAYTQIFTILMNAAQIVLLLFTRNFILYCLIKSGCTLLTNIACSVKANKLYPYIKQKTQETVSKEDIAALKKDTKGLFLTKIASAAFSGTDNIFISVFMNIGMVGILSTYTMIIEIFNSILNKVFYSVTASVGNLAKQKDSRSVEAVLNNMVFLNTALYGYICLGVFLFVRTFVMDIWLGSEYNLPRLAVFFIVLEVFFKGLHYPVYTTRNALGSFSEYRSIFVWMAVLNILLDFLLVKPLGIAGLYIATLVCRGGTSLVDTVVVYRKYLHVPVMKYFLILAKWICFITGVGIIEWFAYALVQFGGVFGFICKIMIFSAIYMLLFFVCFRKTEPFLFYKSILLKYRKRS